MLHGEDVVEQGRLARAEVSGDDGERDLNVVLDELGAGERSSGLRSAGLAELKEVQEAHISSSES